ncbi:cytochrome c oxidase subunit II [Thermoactinomyces mirandus]|uniref:cytochrome c oxidase subunit II n=1 Tax=Thermoactinomyces mirandus TaxID=2756294 RepID=UPI0028A88472|nr:cytochrome c oxidase subunit II [Thermoactinomyces mirandus]
MVSRKGIRHFLTVFVLAALALSGCAGNESLNVLAPSGTSAEKSLDLIKLSLFIMMGVFAVVISIYIYVLIRYRKRKGKDVMPKQVHGNTIVEIIWTSIPIILITILAIPTVKYTFDMANTRASEDSITIKVTGYQYWWEFEYPDLGIKTSQELHIPVGKQVNFILEGKDVIHSFWIPALGGKMDVIPGRTNTMPLDAKKPGVYQGKCAELCGAGHALMDFKVVAQEEEDFNKWVAQMQKPSPVQTASQKQGEELYRQNCLGCHAGTNPNVQGPDLTKFGTRTTIAGILENNEKNLKMWMMHTTDVKPGSLMPKIDYLQPQEMEALVDYLMSRK